MCALPMGIVASVRGAAARAHVRAIARSGRGAHAAGVRALSTSAITRDEGDPFFRAGPMPLPPDEQREFERLLRDKQGA